MCWIRHRGGAVSHNYHNFLVEGRLRPPVAMLQSVLQSFCLVNRGKIHLRTVGERHWGKKGLHAGSPASHRRRPRGGCPAAARLPRVGGRRDAAGHSPGSCLPEPSAGGASGTPRAALWACTNHTGWFIAALLQVRASALTPGIELQQGLPSAPARPVRRVGENAAGGGARQISALMRLQEAATAVLLERHRPGRRWGLGCRLLLELCYCVLLLLTV